MRITYQDLLGKPIRYGSHQTKSGLTIYIEDPHSRQAIADRFRGYWLIKQETQPADLSAPVSWRSVSYQELEG